MKRFVLAEIGVGERYVGDTNSYCGPKENIHEGEQALLEAVLKKLEGCLSYGTVIKGDLFISRMNPLCTRLIKSPGTANYSLIFTPPEPEKPTLDGLLAQLRKEMCMTPAAIELAKQIVRLKEEP